MALGQFDFYSNSLRRAVTFHILLPNDVATEGNEHFNRKMKTLYLLHGYAGNNKSWLLNSNIEELACRYNLAVVFPAGENCFYIDGEGVGKAYCTYVGNELVEYTRRVFGLSREKEDTYIAGFSMGGFGAIHVGLAYPETFRAMVGLSSALIAHNIAGKKEGFSDPIADYYYYRSVFGDLDKLLESSNNPEYQITKLKQEGKEIPAIYMACGTEDFLLEENRIFHRFLTKEEVPVTYIESPGAHDWKFWNHYLEPSIQWMLER